ncbi:carbonic anhydrase family protein [Methylosinus sp. H3A]|nr:carbonic anhydrase family protein [Methylosinus sp. H3A]
MVEIADLLVVGSFLVAGAPNKALSAVMAAAPKEEGKTALKAPVDASALLPKGRKFFRYEGSLTTPPCSEVVHWYVFAQPVAVAKADIDAFETLFPMNARPAAAGASPHRAERRLRREARARRLRSRRKACRSSPRDWSNRIFPLLPWRPCRRRPSGDRPAAAPSDRTAPRPRRRRASWWRSRRARRRRW